MMKTKLNIEGMSCAHCVRHVKEALEEINGVISADVDLDNHSALVEHDEGVTIEKMSEALLDAGYKAV